MLNFLKKLAGSSNVYGGFDCVQDTEGNCSMECHYKGGKYVCGCTCSPY
ncbi:MAG: hypothetical protein ACM32O_16180 [Clostridia bacterium]